MTQKTDRVLVVTPTYNERENLPLLAEQVFRYCPDAELLVVDDASPDGTGRLAEDLNARHPRLNVLHRQAKTGLGDAYLEAFRYALDRDVDFVITMDADLSHNPSYLPAMIAAMSQYDVVVGSRYIRGISIVNWPLRRLMLSQAANWYARTITGLRLRDCTSGFIGFRKRVLEALPLHRIRSQGYVFIVEMKLLSWLAGFSMAEIPIIFVERAQGASKMSGSVALEGLLKVFMLRLTAGRTLKS